MFCISFTNYDRYGEDGWDVILQCAESLGLLWMVDNFDADIELDSKHAVYTLDEIESLFRNNSVIFARLAGYHVLSETLDLRSNLEKGICQCAVFCTDQSCFEIYSADTAIIALFVERLRQSGITKFAVEQSIARTSFELT